MKDRGKGTPISEKELEAAIARLISSGEGIGVSLFDTIFVSRTRRGYRVVVKPPPGRLYRRTFSSLRAAVARFMTVRQELQMGFDFEVPGGISPEEAPPTDDPLLKLLCAPQGFSFDYRRDLLLWTLEDGRFAVSSVSRATRDRLWEEIFDEPSGAAVFFLRACLMASTRRMPLEMSDKPTRYP